jgi:hypothetical protein
MSKVTKKHHPDIVTTVSGIKETKAACRYIMGQYYKTGISTEENSGDVYQIDIAKSNLKKWYRFDTGYIIYDHTNKMYMLKTNLEAIVENGIVGFEQDGTATFGSFSHFLTDPPTTEVSIGNIIYICLSEDLVKNNLNYKEAIFDGVYYKRNSIPAIKFIEPVKCSQEYKNSLNYDSKGITSQWMDFHGDLYNPNYFRQVEVYAPILKGLSFGVEFETIKGKIPEKICKPLGLIPLRDGSIDGVEYVTIPLVGQIGMQTLIDSVLQLKKRTRFDNNCALHIHIGNIPRTEEFFIGLYKVLFRLQDEIYDMFPFHKLKNLGIKKKHYTKPLPIGPMLKLDKKINSKTVRNNFNVIYNFLSMGSSYADFGNHMDNITTHPSDPQGSQKWNIRTRYHWVNLIPLLFGNKQTVEFRIHTPTYDNNKIINYLIICTSIISYIKENLSNILKDASCIADLTLNDVLRNTLGNDNKEILSEVSNYIDHRKQYINHKTRQGDLIANEDDFIYNSRHINWNKNMTSEEILVLRDRFAKRLTSKKRNTYDLINNVGQPITPTHAVNTTTFLTGIDHDG